MSKLADLQPDFLSTSLEAGQEEMAQKMRLILYKTEPEQFELLNYEDDDIFLEPLLFSYFTDPQPSLTLEQILYGYIPERFRPPTISVFANEWGIVELPCIGYLRTNAKNRKLCLSYDHKNDEYELKSGNDLVDNSLEAPLLEEGTTIEICRHNSSLWSRFFTNDSQRPAYVDVEGSTHRHAVSVARALEIIRETIPSYYEQILIAVKKILLYDAPSPYSFATPSAHGVAFLNTSPNDDDVFFIEDLIHQCGHVIFTAIAQDAPLFDIDPNTPLKNITREENETRDVFTTLHGVYTETWMNICMDICCDRTDFTPRQMHELLGRFSYILTRFGVDFQSLYIENMFAENGRQLMGWIEQVYRDIVGRRYELLSKFDISGQPYCFSYDTYLEKNALDELSALV